MLFSASHSFLKIITNVTPNETLSTLSTTRIVGLRMPRLTWSKPRAHGPRTIHHRSGRDPHANPARVRLLQEKNPLFLNQGLMRKLVHHHSKRLKCERHQPEFKQNSSYSVSRQYPRNPKTQLKTNQNQKNNQKTNQPTKPIRRGRGPLPNTRAPKERT